VSALRTTLRPLGRVCKQSAGSGARYSRPMIGGGIVMVVLMILILPVAVMLGGAIWSALMGFLLSEEACDEAEAA
jgi:hypothetical protein